MPTAVAMIAIANQLHLTRSRFVGKKTAGAYHQANLEAVVGPIHRNACKICFYSGPS